jgi:hypothetical protein
MWCLYLRFLKFILFEFWLFWTFQVFAYCATQWTVRHCTSLGFMVEFLIKVIVFFSVAVVWCGVKTFFRRWASAFFSGNCTRTILR